MVDETTHAIDERQVRLTTEIPMWMFVECIAESFGKRGSYVVHTPKKQRGQGRTPKHLVSKKPTKFLESSFASDTRAGFQLKVVISSLLRVVGTENPVIVTFTRMDAQPDILSAISVGSI